MKKKYTLLSLFLCAALLLVSACGGPAAPSAPAEPSSAAPSQESSSGAEPSQPQEPSSASQEEAAAVVPDDSSNLKVLLQMTAPEKEVYLSGKPEFSTQEDADACRQWLDSLKAGEITAMYGNVFPVDAYRTVEISMEDSRKIVDLLRSIAPDLSPLPGNLSEECNPPTGGGWTIAIYLGEEAAEFSFNGEWVNFLRPGQGYFLDVDGTSAQESCYQIDEILGRYANTFSPVTETYFPSDVQAIYALDKESYVMAKVEDGYADSKTIWEGLENRTPSGGEPSGYGFLIFTQEGKEYVYLEDGDEDLALNKACQAALINSPLHPSWLIHMTPERMVSANSITDPDKLLALGKFLKEEITVGEQTSSHAGPTNPDMPAGLLYLTITFDSGVKYTIIGYDGINDGIDGTGTFSIYTSDLDRSVGYTSLDNANDRINAFLDNNK